LRRRGRVTIGGAGLAAIAVVVLLASGCGYGGVATAGDHADLQNGESLFNGAGLCSTCHTLQAAGSTGTVGPNLDSAFVADRRAGYDSSAIENVVLDQIRLGSGPIATYTKAEHGVKGLTSQTQMPQNLVRGQDAIDVAAYIASVAGLHGYTKTINIASLGTDGNAIDQAACGSCHTLADAGITGKVGPNLDQLMPAYAIVLHQVTVGGGVMPAFAGKLTAAQIQAVARYVSSVAGKK
jgi:cytochrome c6